MYRTVVTICTASLTFNNSTFCPHSVFICFVWISEHTAIISLYNIKWLVFITKTESVYCAVTAQSWYVIKVICEINLIFISLICRCQQHFPSELHTRLDKTHGQTQACFRNCDVNVRQCDHLAARVHVCVRLCTVALSDSHWGPGHSLRFWEPRTRWQYTPTTSSSAITLTVKMPAALTHPLKIIEIANEKTLYLLYSRKAGITWKELEEIWLALLCVWIYVNIFKNEIINNTFIENVTWAAPWCGRTEPLESSPPSPAVTYNIHVIRAARVSVLAKWTVLGVICTAHDWPVASSSRYFGALDKTHPPPTHPHGLIGNVPVHICTVSDTQHSHYNTWRCIRGTATARSACMSVCIVTSSYATLRTSLVNCSSL